MRNPYVMIVGIAVLVLAAGCSSPPTPTAANSTVATTGTDNVVVMNSLEDAATLSDAAVVASPISHRGVLMGTEVTGEPLFTQEMSYWRMSVVKSIAGEPEEGSEFFLQLPPGDKAPRATYLLTAEPHGGTPAVFEGLPVYGLLPGVVPMTGEGKLRSAIKGDNRTIPRSEVDSVLRRSIVGAK